MNAPYYDHSQIDYTDGFNPLAVPAFGEQVNPYVYDVLSSEVWRELRSSNNIEQRVLVAPEAQYAVLGPLAVYDAVAPIRAGSWIFGISCSSSRAEGALIQVGMPNGLPVFPVKPNIKSMSGATPFYLPCPAGIPEAGDVRIRIENQANAANTVQVCVWAFERK